MWYGYPVTATDQSAADRKDPQMVSTTPKRKHRFARCPVCHRPSRQTYDGKLFKHYQYDGTDFGNHCPGSGQEVQR